MEIEYPPILIEQFLQKQIYIGGHIGFAMISIKHVLSNTINILPLLKQVKICL